MDVCVAGFADSMQGKASHRDIIIREVMVFGERKTGLMCMTEEEEEQGPEKSTETEL